MTEQNKKIQVLSRKTDGFTAVINRNPPLRKEDCAICAPADSKPAHVCLAANCGTLLAPEDFFCEYHFQKLPADLLWAYVKSADGPPRQMLLQQMADHLEREASSHLELLRECAEFLDSIGRVELFRCVKCRTDQTIFIDDEVANRFDSLLNRVQAATRR